MTKFCFEAVDEKTLFIDLPGTKLKIKGILRGKLADPLVILIHGRPGGGNDVLEFLGARYLSEQGYNSLRLFLYDHELNTRNLIDCTLQTHANDLDVVVSFLRAKGLSQIFAVGHSYGGPTILRAKSKLSAAVLWDPAHGLYWQNKDPTNEKQHNTKMVGDINIGLSGKGYIEPKEMVEDENSWGDTSQWATGKGYPLKIISAPKGLLNAYGKLYYQAADKPKAYTEIKGAGHNFNESDEIMLELFKETVSWFNKANND